MSLYNMLFGQNPNTDIILAILGLRKNDVQRYRDCSFEEGGIQVYTRTGGGNREYYPNEKLTSSPYYIKDEDDDFDSTYATFHFRIPDEISADVAAFKDVRTNGISGPLIQWVLRTLERPETAADVRAKLWDEQNRLVQGAKALAIVESNGHTVVPLDDGSCERLLKLMEAADGEQLSYSVRPFKVVVEQHVPRWAGLDKDKTDSEREMCQVKVRLGDKWEVDGELLARWIAKFGDKYPKAIATITKEAA